MNLPDHNTRPVAAAHSFDVASLAKWMDARVDGFRGPLIVEQFKGGQSNPTYLLRTEATNYVLRRKPPGVLLPSAHAVDREFRVISALAKTAVPVARAYALCEDEAVIGTMFYVMGCVNGRILWDPALPGYAPAERTAIFDEMNRVIAALHSVNYNAVGLGDYGRTDKYLERQIARWSKQYRAAETEKVEAFDNLAVQPTFLQVTRPALFMATTVSTIWCFILLSHACSLCWIGNCQHLGTRWSTSRTIA